MEPFSIIISNRLMSIGALQKNKALLMKSTRSDPIFLLQFLAERGILYDLSNLCACGTIPFIVTFFISRDGFFTLYGTGIFLTSCDLSQLWARFMLVLLIKIAVAKAARMVLTRNMRKTILVFGTSAMATELVNHFQLTKGQKPSVEEERKARSGLVRKYLSGEQLDAEEIKSIETDFDFANLTTALCGSV